MPDSPYSSSLTFCRSVAIKPSGFANPSRSQKPKKLAFSFEASQNTHREAILCVFSRMCYRLLVNFRALTKFCQLGISAFSGYQREFQIGLGFADDSQGKRLFCYGLPNTTGVTYVAIDGSGKFT